MRRDSHITVNHTFIQCYIPIQKYTNAHQMRRDSHITVNHTFIQYYIPILKYTTLPNKYYAISPYVVTNSLNC